MSRRTLVGLVAALLATTATPAPSARPTPAVDQASPASVAAGWHEAKLRKLHLVRPDLISYPLFFDVIC